MRISQLKALELRKMPEAHKVWPYLGTQDYVVVTHRGLEYKVGHWGDWMGEFYVIEVQTGIIFRGPLSYIKELIILCSACVYEPDEVR